jgi:hypothetical protein
MTGWDLYQMVGNVLDGKSTPQEIVDILYTTEGRLDYGTQGGA